MQCITKTRICTPFIVIYWGLFSNVPFVMMVKNLMLVHITQYFRNQIDVMVIVTFRPSPHPLGEGFLVLFFCSCLLFQPSQT